MASKYQNECDIVATLTPKPGKIDRVAELLTDLTDAVKRNEQGVFSFHLYRDFDRASGEEELVLVEKYADKDAYDYHAETEEFKRMHGIFKDEALMAKPIVIKSVKPIVGFSR